MNIFKSREYKEGWEAGKSKKKEIDNPYNQAATMDNRDRGMNGSPWWDTNYKPFLEWEKGRLNAILKFHSMFS